MVPVKMVRVRTFYDSNNQAVYSSVGIFQAGRYLEMRAPI